MRRARRAHPRSRGENAYVTGPDNLCSGSSPLTRGKRGTPSAADFACGLIPAHAGKTASPTRRSLPTAAHPRSRGENFTDLIPALPGVGSSPLTRGKPGPVELSTKKTRLIPAHAGKTAASVTLNFCSRGSSPLTRGKRQHQSPSTSAVAAHPRSRGENRHTSRR